MKKSRRKFSASFKAKVAIEALKEHSSLQELSAQFELHLKSLNNFIIKEIIQKLFQKI